MSILSYFWRGLPVLGATAFMRCLTLVLCVLSIGFISSPTQAAVVNPDFEIGDFTGWALYTTSFGTIGIPQVELFDTNGNGTATNAARFVVGQAGGPCGIGGGMSQPRRGGFPKLRDWRWITFSQCGYRHVKWR